MAGTTFPIERYGHLGGFKAGGYHNQNNWTWSIKRGYSRTELISETIVNEVTNRIVYRRRMECDLKIVPYNLQMIMDWDSHLNIEYSGSAYCALYMYKYCYKGAAKKERVDLGSEKEHDSLDEIKLFIYGRIMSSMSAVWRKYGYQDYPAP